MIITEIRCNNFFRLYGECVIDCIVNAEKNVTVIRGDNGTGKTTMLNAFYWCFYGDVMLPFFVDGILNELAKNQLEDGKTTAASVEITFKEKGVDYTVIRKRIFLRRGVHVNRLGDEDFRIEYKNKQTGNPLRVPDPEGFIENLIPQKLRGFFLFDGENIDRLAKVDGREEIRQAILDILGLTKLERLKEYFQKIEAELTKAQKSYLSGVELDLLEECEAYNARRAQKNEEYTHVRENIRKVNANIKRISDILQNHNSASIRALENERISLKQLIDRIENEIKQKNRLLLSFSTKDFKNFLIAFSFPNIFSFLENKRQKGELPSDIKAQFIDDMVTKQRCICERELLPGTPAYDAVMRKKANAGRTELDDAYHKITAYIKQQDESASQFFVQYHKIKEEILKLEQQVDLRQRRYNEITIELRNSGLEEIKRNEDQLTQFKKDLRNYEHQELRLESEIEDLDKKIEQKNKEITGLQVRGEQAKAIKARRDMIVKLAQLNQEIRAYFIESTRTNLDAHIREVFNSMKEKEYRFARLTNDFILEITNNLADDDDRRVLSTGEGQVASLAFIASLVSYARDKQANKLLSDFSGGDFPIVMDSPFGNLSAGHKQNVAREISTLASQVIVIVSDEQWTSVVEQNIMPHVSVIYKMSDGTIDSQTNGEHTIVRRQP